MLYILFSGAKEMLLPKICSLRYSKYRQPTKTPAPKQDGKVVFMYSCAHILWLAGLNTWAAAENGVNEDHSIPVWLSAHSPRRRERNSYHENEKAHPVFPPGHSSLKMYPGISFCTPEFHSWKGIKRNLGVIPQVKKADTSKQTQLPDATFGQDSFFNYSF